MCIKMRKHYKYHRRKWVNDLKEHYITITGMGHYYGLTPFKVGKRIKCVKEPENVYDSEAIRCQLKHVGKVGYVANSPFTVATGTKSAGGISHKVKKNFKVEVMFITGHSVICKVVEGLKENKEEKSSVTDNSIIAKDDEKQIIQT